MDSGPTWLLWWLGWIFILGWPCMLPIPVPAKVAAEVGWLLLVGAAAVQIATQVQARRARRDQHVPTLSGLKRHIGDGGPQ